MAVNNSNYLMRFYILFLYLILYPITISNDLVKDIKNSVQVFRHAVYRNLRFQD